ncbi:hypothetical protein MRB53_039967 [Persea americana]|nr:hypothetical protein MRB53_039967 [Persea americana]
MSRGHATMEKDLTSTASEREASTETATSEQVFLRDQLRIDDIAASFLSIYAYATKLDLCVVTGSLLCALVAGAVSPVAAVCSNYHCCPLSTFPPFLLPPLKRTSPINFALRESQYIGANIVLAFVQAESLGSVVEALLARYVLYYIYLLIIALGTNFLSMAGMNWTGARITRRIKLQYFASILRQNIALFDDNGSKDLLYQLIEDTKAVQLAISFKLSQTASAVGTLLTAYILSFALDWVLTFELIACLAFSLVLLFFRREADRPL